MEPPLCYTGCALDRAARLRTDEDWLAGRLKDPDTRFVPVAGEGNLIVPGAAPRVAALAAGDLGDISRSADRMVFLGLDDGERAWFAVDLEDGRDAEPGRFGDGVRFTSLRRVGAVMDQADGALLAYARGMTLWRRRHCFCGACGAPTRSRHGGHLRLCTRGECAAEHFPRTDPAVIMLVTRSGNDGDACLLARQARWPKGMMSTLAGFVEPGETLEAAVAREVEEESGIRVARVCYQGSQPWPFPSSLMLGFRAEAEAGQVLDVDPDELDDARWFSRQEVAAANAIGLKLPGADSIARRLIETWVNEAGVAEAGVNEAG